MLHYQLQLKVFHLLNHCYSLYIPVCAEPYGISFHFCTADALVSDATTFMVEFGMTGKPVMYTPKEDGESVIESAYLPGVQICSGDDDFLDYLMTAGKRPSSCEAGFFEREFGACDGHNGERIGSYIIEEMQSSLRDYGNVFFAKCSEGE